jgi:S1-C subfamily serine protease
MRGPLLTLLITTLLAATAVAQDAPPPPPDPPAAGECLASYADVIDAMSSSVVAVNTLSSAMVTGNIGAERDEKATGIGTGVVVFDGRYVLTNAHVVQGAPALAVTLRDGTVAKVSLRGMDEDVDLALLELAPSKLLGSLGPAPIGESDVLRVGEEVIAIGHPLGLEFSASVGIVSGVGRSGFGIASYEDYIQTDAAINPGNSGGPLVDRCGEVIGINTWVYARGNRGDFVAQLLGFAIPIDAAMWIAEQLRDHGNVVHPWAGVMLETIPQETKFFLSLPTGLLIRSVEEGSPAARAGIRPDDLLLSVDGHTMGSTRDFQRYVSFRRHPGEAVLFTIRRAGEEMQQLVVLGLAPGEVYLGMSVSPDLKDPTRLHIASVEPDGPASRAGLQPGDLIVKAGTDEASLREIDAVDTLMTVLASASAHRKLAITYERGGLQTRTVIEMEIR